MVAVGLSSADAQRRLIEEGYNELPSERRRGLLSIAMDVLKEPMISLLIACGAIYFLLGDRREALILIFFVLVVISITLYQERRAEGALNALRALSSPRALVIRDGTPVRIPGREVVRGDLIVLEEGDRVPADAAVISCTSLLVDESILTGESMPVRKIPCEDKEYQEVMPPGGDDVPFVYTGTLVVQGRGLARVVATGSRTLMGRIGASLKSIELEESRLKRETRSIVRRLTLFGLALSTVLLIAYALETGDLLRGLLAGITLTMAILPEEFPVVLTIFLALGAWRLSRINVLTRNLSAIETLGSVTVLCTDKTGTVTLNRMRVRKIFARGRIYDVDGALPEDVHDVVEFGILAGRRDPFNPMEIALQELGRRELNGTEHIHNDWTFVQEYPLTDDILAMSMVWMHGGEYVIAAKGAPESIFDLCHLDGEELNKIYEVVERMAADGLRVLGVARAAISESELPDGQHGFDFQFMGLLGFSDTIRPGVPDAVNECQRAGVRVMLITGDHPITAASIASSINLNRGSVLTGPEIESMSDEELSKRLRDANIFARMVPEQKLRLVELLKSQGEIVAMTGDGVNDAPALKSSHIGIAMGSRGTDVARESADIVLLDDDFSSIVKAIRLGRRIFDNIRKATAYILAIHVPIAGMSILPVALGQPLLLMPVHIAFLELVIDPACSIAFEAEAEESDVMSRPPMNPKAPLVSTGVIALGALQGISVLAVLSTIYLMSIVGDMNEVRALIFTTLVLANLLLILTNRSWSQTILQSIKTRNSALWMIFGGTVLLLSMILYIPSLREMFHFGYLHPKDIMICLALASTSVLWFEAWKMIFRRGRAGSE
ncbi:MAG: cation-translocating P-type ATPase [Methanothrix sp.]|uniref:P-type Cu(+) transporter n=1 Tax=Methanothrix thermoacetophila (strain DSM 6194 / JCM 14653 / NBRC 101360 / PT) TaxID=349307 RepID=A0B971_METTP|nr:MULTISPECIES: cation-translocating P-type ATPase [Methanothrix]ABK15245.1 ATPase, P-type (transporting), HAD superfamily, subfamily IC [Methanothrix thermoacetophila PT]MBC7079171.1 cation-translocating P-type ATPase [Methanothrix sp.]NPU86635.1 cation-translocating P-type ATPase [Methanothrix sp.]